MKRIKIAVVGYGNRGEVYADYYLAKSEEVEIVGIIDPNEFKLNHAKEKYSLDDSVLFTSFDEYLKKGERADVVINATMDQIHYETAKAILSNKFNMLMEKPIVPKKDELLELRDLAKKNGCLVFVCHVLRYTPFYKTIKKLINDNVIGEIMTMEMNEHVCVPHFLTSYVRGKWNSEKECGSGFLLAKCCHDMDLICWLNNASKPVDVASFASRSRFILKNKPEGGTDYCYNCPHEKTCIYSAMPMYYDGNVMPFLVLDSFNKPYDQITKEEKYEYLKSNNFGKCAYDAGGDIVDRQNLIVNFENGSLATFNLVGGAAKADRYIHIVGTLGELEGKIEENKIILREYKRERVWYVEKELDVTKDIIITVDKINGGHSGGDFMIMNDLVRYLNGDKTSISMTSIDDSVNGHLVVYAAEESRKTRKVVNVE